jgi:hypothetical protein
MCKGVSVDDDAEVEFSRAKLGDLRSKVEHDLVHTSTFDGRRYKNCDLRSSVGGRRNETEPSLFRAITRHEQLYAFKRSRREGWGRFQFGRVDADNQARDTWGLLTAIIVRHLGGTGRHNGQRRQGDRRNGAYNLRLAPASTGSYAQGTGDDDSHSTSFSRARLRSARL